MLHEQFAATPFLAGIHFWGRRILVITDDMLPVMARAEAAGVAV
jgi:hypothetical protein